MNTALTSKLRPELFWLTLSGLCLFPMAALAHGVGAGDQGFMVNAVGAHPVQYAYLGAKHMVTGYDHLAYLAGVVFFLQNPRDVIKFVSLFALGHSITLLTGVLAGFHVNAYAVDAVIGLSVCYKALENLGVLKRYTGIDLDPRIAVFGFGLVHGFGLSTKLQDVALSSDGLIANMVSFNVGVELGQVFALGLLLTGLQLLRQRPDFSALARWVNIALFGFGVLLVLWQVAGLIVAKG